VDPFSSAYIGTVESGSAESRKVYLNSALLCGIFPYKRTVGKSFTFLFVMMLRKMYKPFILSFSAVCAFFDSLNIKPVPTHRLYAFYATTTTEESPQCKSKHEILKGSLYSKSMPSPQPIPTQTRAQQNRSLS